MKAYQVKAVRPTSGVGSSMDSRVVGPFVSRRAAEDAAARLVDDPRRYADIKVESIDIDDDEE